MDVRRYNIPRAAGHLVTAGCVAGLVDGRAVGSRGWTVSQTDSVEEMNCWETSLVRSKVALWAKGLSRSVPRRMKRMGPENALASREAERAMVISPPFSGMGAAVEVMEAGRSAAVAIT